MRTPPRRTRVGGWLLAPPTVLVAIVIPALAYTLLGSWLPALLPALQYAVATAYALTAAMTLLEARAAMGNHDEPATADVRDAQQLAELPTLTAIVSAYLPNEQELVAETIVHLATELRVAPGGLQIILAYNTPQDMPDVEGVLASLAALNVVFEPLRVPTSRSKAENVNAAIGLARGEVTVLLDADHRPAADAAVRALRWFPAGYDIVQGRCVIRDSATNWLSRIVAVEFEQIYAVSHAGRSLAFDTAMFCGTNGWWRTSVLRRIGMDDQMLTEDIDSSVRALLAGHRTIHDRTIVSTELAPPTVKAWWGQRMRWAQGWFQVTLKHQGAIVRSPRLTGELKLYWTYLLGWRELFPVLSLQIVALLVANVLLDRAFTWFYDPFLVVTTVLTLIAGPLAALMTYRVALDDHRRELRGWFFVYAAGSLVYTTAKNTVAMVATVRELIGQRGWIVTTRAAAKRPRAATTALLAVLAGALAVSAPPSAQALAATETATVRLAPLASSMTLAGRAPVTTISVPVPADWRSAGGGLHLRWQASPAVTANSTLTVRVDGALLGARALQGGTGGVDLAIPAHAVPPGHRMEIELEGQLHTRVDAQCCVPDPATGAIVTLDPHRTQATLVGSRNSSVPLLSDLPGSLVDVIGSHVTPLYLVLPGRPTNDDVRAAALIAGAVARATGAHTIPIAIRRGTPRRSLRALGGQVVAIVPTGRPRLDVRRRPDGRLVVTVGGRGDGVVRAAWALARARPGYLAGSSALVASGLPADGAKLSTTTAALTPGGTQGTGRLEFAAGFRLPESRELIDGRARLVLDAGYSAPSGGRVAITLNGQPLLTRALSKQGLAQLRIAIGLVKNTVDAVDERDALAYLAPGDNFLTFRMNLPAGEPVGGAGDAEPPAIRLLPGSAVRFASTARVGPSSLDLWPWPYATATSTAMTHTTFVLPADPDRAELASVISTIAEVSRWMAAPAAPRIAIGPPRLPAGDVVALGRGAAAPAPLPAGAPAAPRAGLLETYSSDGRQILVAFGLAALRPLAARYRPGKVRGSAVIAGRHGRITTLVRAPRPASFEKGPLPWKIPTAIIVLGVLLLIALRVRRVRRRLAELPAPAPASRLDDAAVRAELADWDRHVREEGGANGSLARDDAPTAP